MQTLLDFFAVLGAASAEAFWLPLLAWTALALPFWGLLRTWTGHPLAHYRARQALLLTLPASLLLAAATEWSVWSLWPAAEVSPATVHLGPVELGTVVASAAPAAPALTLQHGLGALTLLALLLAAGRAAQLGIQAIVLAAYRRRLRPTTDEGVRREAEALANRYGVRRPVRVAVTEDASVPLTFGGRRPVIALPPAIARDGEALRMTLAHELVHVRRRDYEAQWAETLAALPVPWHPLAWTLRREAGAYRERACDAAVLGGPVRFSARRYARMLLDLAAPRRPALALAITESDPSLKSRIEAMAVRPVPFRHPVLLAAALSVLLVALSMGVAACSELGDPDDVSPADAPTAATSEAGSTEGVFMVVEEQPEMIGGQQALYEEIEYPEFARKAGIEGTVFLQFVVDGDGNVTQPTVLKSPHELLSEEAVRAIQQMKFEPGRQDGATAKVRMSQPIRFSLGKDGSETTSDAELMSPPAPGDAGGAFVVVEQMPEIEGGAAALYDDVSYPASAREAGVEGTVIVKFVVEKDGRVSEAEVARTPNAALGEAALRAIEAQTFVPGRDADGQPARVRMAQPIKFSLGERTGATSSTQETAPARASRGMVASLGASPTGSGISDVDAIESVEVDKRGATPTVRITFKPGTPDEDRTRIRDEVRQQLGDEVVVE